MAAEAPQLKCQQCSSAMKQDAIKTGNTALGVILVIVGFCLLFVFPFGTVIGVALWVIAASQSRKHRKVWKCISCGYIFDRA